MTASKRRKAGARARPPKPRGDKRQRTRAALIEAAGEVLAAKGLDRTSLEEVAQRAGMSRGAIYGNFRDKEELFLAVAAARWRPIVSAATSEMSLEERMAAHGEAVRRAAAERRREAVGATSFVQYALTHEPLRLMLVQANAHIYEGAAERLKESRAAADLRVPPERFVRVVHALTDGLMILHALTPELITAEVIADAFRLLAGPARGE